MTSLLWTDQTTNTKKWATFITPQDKKITLPPRRYILLGKTLNVNDNQKLRALTPAINNIHSTENAPEPHEYNDKSLPTATEHTGYISDTHITDEHFESQNKTGNFPSDDINSKRRFPDTNLPRTNRGSTVPIDDDKQLCTVYDGSPRNARRKRSIEDNKLSTSEQNSTIPSLLPVGIDKMAGVWRVGIVL
jgi:hypothetical protein